MCPPARCTSRPRAPRAISASIWSPTAATSRIAASCAPPRSAICRRWISCRRATCWRTRPRSSPQSMSCSGSVTGDDVWALPGGLEFVMAESPQLPPEDEVRARWGAFAWTEENAKKAKEIVARYPAGRAQSASLPLLDLAQRQVGAETKTQGWLPVPVIEFVAREIGVPSLRVFEVVTLYTMFYLMPVARYYVQ